MTRPVNPQDWRAARRQRQKELRREREYTLAINNCITRSERRAIDLGGAEFLPLAALDALTLADEVLRLRGELTRLTNLHNEQRLTVPQWRQPDWNGSW